MDRINQSGISIYVKLPVTTLVQRLAGSKRTRPLIKGKSNEELYEYVGQTLLQREEFYSKATIVVDGLKTNANELATMLRQLKYST